MTTRFTKALLLACAILLLSSVPASAAPPRPDRLQNAINAYCATVTDGTAFRRGPLAGRGRIAARARAALVRWCAVNATPVVTPPAPVDTDGDGVADNVDNCPRTANPDQEDTNGDGVGEACTDS